ncbi:MAG TPA: TadE family protein [Myxococcota bacterium]|nr:TadE family protein [Myxococcota bacterium]
MKRNRRGANHIEFALVLPIFIAIILGMMEYSWAFFIRSAVTTSVRDGCRSGSVIHPDDDYETVAVEAMRETLAEYQIDCADLSTTCTEIITTSGMNPAESLECRLEVDYDPLIGYVPVPTDIAAESIVLFELQR